MKIKTKTPLKSEQDLAKAKVAKGQMSNVILNGETHDDVRLYRAISATKSVGDTGTHFGFTFRTTDSSGKKQVVYLNAAQLDNFLVQQGTEDEYQLSGLEFEAKAVAMEVAGRLTPVLLPA